ncbi:hypothetical protein CPC08DRAFT_712594, partial [Agrocybe pediades]
HKVRMEMFEDHQSPSTQAKDEESGRCEQNRQRDWNEEEEGWMDEDGKEAVFLASQVSGDASVSLRKGENRHPKEQH